METPEPVLLVEDDDDHAALFRELFAETGLGHRLLRAASLAEADEFAARAKPWVVVLDLGLPDSTGLETIQRVERTLPLLPVVVLTANAEEGVSVEAIRSGAQDYLVKGQFTAEMLKRSLRYASERKRIWIELDRKNREVEAFASMASHDLQSPLRRIGEAAELLAERIGGDDAGDTAFWLETLQRDSRRLQLLVSDMLRFAHTGRDGLAPTVFPLEQAVDNALSMLAEVVEAADAKIHKDGLPEVMGDQRLLEALLQNLISNAIKYVRDAAPQVWITAEESEGAHVIHVRDNGIGIDPNHFERIFEPCVRAVNYDEFEGSGLGLASCRKIIEAHRGTIQVDSEPGRGSVFSFTLPNTARV